MIKLRKHPDDTWTAPYKDTRLDDSEFIKLSKVEKKECRNGDLLFTSGKTVVRMRLYESGIIRFTYAPDGILPTDDTCSEKLEPYGIKKIDRPPEDYACSFDGECWIISTDEIIVTVRKNPFMLQVTDSNGKVLLKTLPEGLGYRVWDGNSSSVPGTEGAVPGNSGYETLAFFEKQKDSAFFGFGGRTHRINRTGSTADLFAVKVEMERGDYGGFPLPYFLDVKGYGFLLDNPWPHVYFDMGREFKDKWFVHTPGGFLDFYILSGPTFPAINKKYCGLTGFPTLPPKWVLGFWVSWASPYYRVEEYMEIASRLRREGWPFDVMVADMNWRGGDFNIFLEGDSGNNLDWHDKRFGDGNQLIKLLHRSNAHLCLHLNTVMYTGELLEEGLNSGALRKVEDGVVVPRVTDKDSLNWYWNTHEPRIKDGVDLWWTDNGERVNGVLATGLPSRNLFGHLWNKAIYTRMEEAGLRGRLVLSRGGWLGAQQFTLTWPGDTGPGVERLREDLRWHLNCSLSGIPYNTVDLGGFMILSKHFRNEQKEWMEIIIHSNENIIRRVVHCMLLFTVPRVHGVAKLPWMYSKDTADMWRFFLNLRYRMFPYIYSWIVIGAKTGEPVYRPLVWMHQDDPDVYDIDDELFCGNDLLFAPVVEEGMMEREVYLPEGIWRNFWTGVETTGKRHVVADAPFFEPEGLPFFIRQGAILPMRKRSQYNDEDHEVELMIHIFTGEKSIEGKQRFYDSLDVFYDVAYKIQKEKLHVTISNPLDTERSITLHWHCRPRQINTDADAKSFPFIEEPWDTFLSLPPGGTIDCIIEHRAEGMQKHV